MLTRDISLESIINSNQVPTLPEVAVQILSVAQQPEPSLDELTRIVRMDPAIAGRIVQFANSPLFGIRRTPATIESAVVMLGTTMIRTLVLGFTLAEQPAAEESLRPHFQQIWRETLFQAAAAELLGERHSGIDPAVWFLAGLVQDAGRLVMLNVFRQEYVQNVIRHGADNVSLCDRESQTFGFSHAEVSAALCRSWNLGSDLVRAVTTHHTVHFNGLDSQITTDDGLRAASVCNDYMEAVLEQPESARHAVEQELIQKHRCRPDEVIELLAEIDSRARGLAAVFRADAGEMPLREELLEKAQAALFNIAINEQLRRLSQPSQKRSFTGKRTITDLQHLDTETGAFHEELLEQILPEEISSSREREKTLAVLSVELRQTDDAAETDIMLSAARAIRSCIRPHDRIIRSGASGLIVLLPELGMDMLTQVARRIAEHSEQSLSEFGGSLDIGGLMVIPTGRRPATISSVLAGLKDSLENARKTGREQFNILQGQKLRAVELNE